MFFSGVVVFFACGCLYILLLCVFLLFTAFLTNYTVCINQNRISAFPILVISLSVEPLNFNFLVSHGIGGKLLEARDTRLYNIITYSYYFWLHLIKPPLNNPLLNLYKSLFYAHCFFWTSYMRENMRHLQEFEYLI